VVAPLGLSTGLETILTSMPLWTPPRDFSITFWIHVDWHGFFFLWVPPTWGRVSVKEKTRVFPRSC